MYLGFGQTKSENGMAAMTPQLQNEKTKRLSLVFTEELVIPDFITCFKFAIKKLAVNWVTDPPLLTVTFKILRDWVLDKCQNTIRGSLV